MIIIRGLLGFVLGVILPISLLYISEISTVSLRGRCSIILNFFFLMGKIYLICLAMLFLKNLKEGDWRSLALANSLPCLIVFIIGWW